MYHRVHMALVESKLQQFALARKREDHDVLAYLSTGFRNGFSDVWYESAEMICHLLNIPGVCVCATSLNDI